MYRSIVLAGACCLVLSAAMPQAARAADPTSDQIVKSLTPGVGMQGTSRGLRPLAKPAEGAAAPAAGPAATAPASPAQAMATAAPSVSLHVEFATGSAVLTPAAISVLNSLGAALTDPALAPYRFRIEGHTDTVGAPAVNQALSDQRANAVADYLVAHFQVDRARLAPIGVGQAGLAVPTPAQTPEPRNRRVLVVNVGA
jgi:OOP family OmpA-OmpF porin